MKIIIPPPILFIVSALIMWILPPIYLFPRYLILIVILILLSGIVGWGSVWQFFRVKTSVDPIHLKKSHQLVISGMYRFSRNPMYLALALLLFAWGLWLGSVSAVLFVGIFMFVLTEFQIKREEQFLTQRFGQNYLDYRQRVRRWL